MAKHFSGLQRTLDDLDYPNQEVTEKGTLFKITCKAMIKVSRVSSLSSPSC